MNKIDLIKQPVEKELEEFRGLFENSLTSTDPLFGRGVGLHQETERKDDASYFGDADGKIVRYIKSINISCSPVARTASYGQFGTR